MVGGAAVPVGLAERAVTLVRVYHLDVTIPPEYEYPYEPEGWATHCEYHGWVDHNGGANPFSWPQRRNFLSRGAAQKQAARLRRWGAVVDALESEPCVFTGEPLGHVPVPAGDIAPERRAGRGDSEPW